MECWYGSYGGAVLLREAPALPYDRYLPGEIMFWDIDDIAECFSWDPDPRTLKSWLRLPACAAAGQSRPAG